MSLVIIFANLFQALLEMDDLNSSSTMVNYYSDHPPHIRGQVVYVQYSNHEVLKTETPNMVRTL